VIKIERPGTGDFARGYDQRVKGLASHFVWTNRSKESLTLDIKHPRPRGCAAVVDKADIVVQNLAPGAAARLGVSHEALKERRPDLIVCDISGYGDDPANPGPYRDKKAYDLLIQSESGFVSITGTPDEPSKAGLSIADIAAGMYAYSSVLAALLQRRIDGKGRRIDISMLEAMGEWMGYPMYYAFEGAAPPPRAGAAHATIYPYGPFPTGDGRTVMLGLQNEREWTQFCDKVLRHPALAHDERFTCNAGRVLHRDAANLIHRPSRPERRAGGRAARQAQIANAQVTHKPGCGSTANAACAGARSLRPPGRCLRCCRRSWTMRSGARRRGARPYTVILPARRRRCRNRRAARGRR
jgi:crotonobetainyl-CoA:carnitine CoA-transferase CaiB-like acyl-CoA transferase